MPHVKTKGEIAASEGFTDGGYGTNGNPFTGDVFQVGGMFVLEKETVLFAHRSAYAGDVPEVGDIVEAATGLTAEGKASTAVWPGWEAECAEAPEIEAKSMAAILQSGQFDKVKEPRVESRR